MSRKRVLVLAVAVLLSVSAVLAIGILLVGRFGSVEGRILGSTALLAGFGLVALPGVVLLDKERARRLALAGVASSVLGSAAGLVAIWSGWDSDSVGRAVGSLAVVALALSQVCALAARRASTDPLSVRRLFAASSTTAALAALIAVVLIWSDPHGTLGSRGLGSVVVLDLLLAALQPVLARANPGDAAYRFGVVLDSGERVDVTVRDSDIASAAARAIRSVGRRRGSIVELDVVRSNER